MSPHKSFITLIFVAACTILVRAQGVPSGWKFESQRPEIAPVSALDNKVIHGGSATLSLRGGGKDHAAGYWYKVVDTEPGKFYHFKTHFKPQGIDEPYRSVLARVIWRNDDGEVVGFREYPATKMDKTPDGWRVIEQSYQAPKDATSQY